MGESGVSSVEWSELPVKVREFSELCQESKDDPCVAMYGVLLGDSKQIFRKVEVKEAREIDEFDRGLLRSALDSYCSQENEIVYLSFVDSLSVKKSVGVLKIADLLPESREDETSTIRSFLVRVGGLHEDVRNGAVPPLRHEEIEKVDGILFVYQIKDQTLYAYQKITKSYLLKKSAFLGWHPDNALFKLYVGPIIRFAEKFDFIVFNEYICSIAPSTIVNQFGYIDELQSKAANVLDGFGHLLSNASFILSRIEKRRIRTINRLLGVGASKVRELNSAQLKAKLLSIEQYANQFKFDEEEKIVLETPNDVERVLKMLNDELVISPLTETVYESENKQLYSGS